FQAGAGFPVTCRAGRLSLGRGSVQEIELLDMDRMPRRPGRGLVRSLVRGGPNGRVPGREAGGGSAATGTTHCRRETVGGPASLSPRSAMPEQADPPPADLHAPARPARVRSLTG